MSLHCGWKNTEICGHHWKYFVASKSLASSNFYLMPSQCFYGSLEMSKPLRWNIKKVIENSLFPFTEIRTCMNVLFSAEKKKELGVRDET